MKTLTIRQPWASLIAEGVKNVENRTWQNHFRGTILIHSSAAPFRGKPCDILNKEQLSICIAKGIVTQDKQQWRIELPTSALLCAVDVVDCIKDSKSVWAEPGVWHNCLKNVRKFREPVRGVKGSLSLWNWEPSEELKKEIDKTVS